MGNIIIIKDFISAFYIEKKRYDNGCTGILGRYLLVTVFVTVSIASNTKVHTLGTYVLGRYLAIKAISVICTTSYHHLHRYIGMRIFVILLLHQNKNTQETGKQSYLVFFCMWGRQN